MKWLNFYLIIQFYILRLKLYKKNVIIFLYYINIGTIFKILKLYTNIFFLKVVSFY